MEDMKKGVLLQLFGGTQISSKGMEVVDLESTSKIESHHVRGYINILIGGDPGLAKSQENFFTKTLSFIQTFPFLLTKSSTTLFKLRGIMYMLIVTVGMRIMHSSSYQNLPQQRNSFQEST